MFRTVLIYLSQAAWARRLVTRWKFAWRAASRFVAGETLSEALQVVKELNAKGINATLDHLGEHTGDPESAQKSTQDILEIIEAIHRKGVRSGVSIKLTQVGLALGEDLCAENVAQILESARERGIYIRIDMEDSPWTAATLSIFRRMRFERGYENVGIVIQSYLYRSEEDIRQLVEKGAGVRLCKGAYKEPPDIAFPRKKDVDASYDRMTEILIEGARANGSTLVSADGITPPIPAIASHDEKRILHAKAYAQKVDFPKEALEFQMLNGIRRELQESLVAEGYPVRVYVPFGTEWYPYFVRRLAERPANLWFFLSNFFKR